MYTYVRVPIYMTAAIILIILAHISLCVYVQGTSESPAFAAGGNVASLTVSLPTHSTPSVVSRDNVVVLGEDIVNVLSGHHSHILSTLGNTAAVSVGLQQMTTNSVAAVRQTAVLVPPSNKPAAGKASPAVSTTTSSSS